jgi:hypothetical protein
MRRRRDIPTPEEIAEATGGDPEVIKRALDALRFEDENE